jgi:hypothetical protein
VTNEEFLVILEEYIRGLQGPRIMSELSMMLKRSKDAAASHIGQVAMAAATGFQSDNTKLIQLLRAAALYFNQIETDINTVTGDTIKLGVTAGTDFTLSGAPPETLVFTETNYTWVTANTVVVPFTPAPITSGMEFYGVKVDNYVAGDGFDVTLYNPSNNTAGDGPDVYWIGFPNGLNA